MNIGIMQGRLTPPRGKIQSFPAERWRDEFALAPVAGISAIEWIIESPVERNPLWSDLESISMVRCNTGIEFVCADYFMEYPFVRASADDVYYNQNILAHVIRQCSALGVRGIDLPFLDDSEIRSLAEENELCVALGPCLDLAGRLGITIGLETSLPPGPFAALLERCGHPALRVTYDIGNSASMGYDPSEEIAAYGHLIHNVHVKDRLLGGRTVRLGTGNADLPRIFELLRSAGYEGAYTLQAARGDDELRDVMGQVMLMRSLLEGV